MEQIQITLDGIQIIATILLAAFGVRWSIHQARIAKELERDLHLVKVSLDQSTQLLQRAREAALAMHKAYVFLLASDRRGREVDENYLLKHAEFRSAHIELRGLAFAIDDDELCKWSSEINTSSATADFLRDEAAVAHPIQQIHKRIGELLQNSIDN